MALIAKRGFSANGIDVAEGDDVTDKFDSQTVTVLTMMGRIAEGDAPEPVEDAPEPVEDAPEPVEDAPKNRAVKGTKADAAAPTLPTLPTLPAV